MCNIRKKNGQNVWKRIDKIQTEKNAIYVYITEKNQLLYIHNNNEELEESFADVVDLIKSLRKIKTSRIIKGFIGFIHLIYVICV